MEAQAAATKPSKKRLWSEIVRAKLRAQAAALEREGQNPLVIRTLVSRVRSGDPDNLEAQAAQNYLPLFFGKGFTRDREADGVNSYLNYGYTVLRAATARSIVASGLHPSLGLHHKSKGDAMRLADDLMEPFRPAVDLIARTLQQENITVLDPAAKRRLAAVLHADYITYEGVTTLSNALTRLAQSLAQIYLGERLRLALPRSSIPLAKVTTSEPLAANEE